MLHGDFSLIQMILTHAEEEIGDIVRKILANPAHQTETICPQLLGTTHILWDVWEIPLLVCKSWTSLSILLLYYHACLKPPDASELGGLEVVKGPCWCWSGCEQVTEKVPLTPASSGPGWVSAGKGSAWWTNSHHFSGKKKNRQRVQISKKSNCS